MIASFLEPIRRAGLDPVGVDLSAFGMIRALAGSRRRRQRRRGRAAAADRDRPLLQRRRRRRTSPSRAAAPASSPGSRTSGLEAIAGRLATGRGLSRRTRDAVARLRRPRARRSRQIEGDPETLAEARRASRRGRRPGRRAAPLARLLRRPGRRGAGGARSSSAGRAAPSPASPRAIEAGLGLVVPPPGRRPSAASTRARRRV